MSELTVSIGSPEIHRPPFVPSAAISAIERAQLPGPARDDLQFWTDLLTPLLPIKRGIQAHLHRLAAHTGAGYGTVRRKFDLLKKGGPLAIVDRRLAGARWWKTDPEKTALPLVDKALVKLYCERNDRSCRAAVKQLRIDWRKRLVTTTQPLDERTGFPRGWSIENLAKHAPEKMELIAARKGTAPAASERRLVYTTRAGLWVGSHYMFDDLWHDFFVNTFVEKQAGRPLELFSHDLFSARKIRWGIRVRTRKEDGTWHGLAERMTRYILAATLHLDGYSPRGTILVAEHGTAAINDKVEQALLEHTERIITVERSGMQGAAAHAGQYPGIARGNPRMKASLESSNNLTHNVFAAQPGQTGMSRQDRPEELDARLDDNERLLALHGRLSPANQALVQFPLLELNQFMGIAHDLYAQMENDPDHDLEGWIESGHVVQELLLAGQWVPQERLLAGTPEEMALALALIEQGKLPTRPRRMTRREVWDRGSTDLVKLNGAGVVAILGDDLARPEPERVRAGMIEFEDAEVGPGVHRYEAVVFDPWGGRSRLSEGEKYRVFANPFAPQRLFVCDAKLAYLGEAKRIESPSRGNVEAVRRVMGAVAAEEAERLAGVRERHAGAAVEKREREAIAAALETNAPLTEAQHDAARDEERTVAQAASTQRERLAAQAARARQLREQLESHP